MKKLILHNAVYPITLLVVFTLQSCSVIGFGIGRSVDRHLPPQKYLHPDWVSEFKPETKVRVVNENGFIYKGIFHGLDTIPMAYDTLVSVMMETRGQPVKVYLHNIEYINVPKYAKKWKWIGLGIGLAIDAAIIRSGWEPPQWIQDIGGEFIFGVLGGG